MWISSQDGKFLLDAKNFYIINSKDITDIISTTECYQEGEYTILGSYSTEERAKEVLRQIRGQIETNISMDTVYKGVRTVSETVFQMPKE